MCDGGKIEQITPVREKGAQNSDLAKFSSTYKPMTCEYVCLRWQLSWSKHSCKDVHKFTTWRQLAQRSLHPPQPQEFCRIGLRKKNFLAIELFGLQNLDLTGPLPSQKSPENAPHTPTNDINDSFTKSTWKDYYLGACRCTGECFSHQPLCHICTHSNCFPRWNGCILF